VGARARRTELAEVAAFVREHLEAMADSYARIGLRVTALEADADNGKQFPDLLIYVEHEDVDGERVAWHSLDHNGVLEGPGDAATTIAFWALESTASEIRRLPRSNGARKERRGLGPH
jgi:hypothetical protein